MTQSFQRFVNLHCEEDALRTTYTKYEEMMLVSGILTTEALQSEEACRTSCSANSRCVAFTLLHEQLQCTLHMHTPNCFEWNYANATFFRKQCD
ncbi:hypothetical protein ACOMHN_056772 [Nucella lapillus]